MFLYELNARNYLIYIGEKAISTHATLKTDM